MTPDDPDEQRVRDLLTSVGERTPPMPEHVARRLEGALADLAADRTAGGVTSLDDRRRRRWPTVLVAAAAVTVVGFGVGNLLTDGPQMESATQAGDAAREAAPEAGGLAEQPGSADSASRVARLRTGSLAVDVQRLADAALGPAGGRPQPLSSSEPRPRCSLPATRPGEVAYAVRLDGAPATLVFGPEQDGVRRAAVYTCGDASRPTVTTTVTVE